MPGSEDAVRGERTAELDAATEVAERLRLQHRARDRGQDRGRPAHPRGVRGARPRAPGGCPGTAKTVLARSLAASIDGTVAARIQCTPDLQPTDITGLSVWDPETRRFEFRAGPVFANVVLVDEVNRALPKAQSALLEAMAEGQVTVDGATRRLPRRSS